MSRVIRQAIGAFAFGLAVFVLGIVCLIRDQYDAALVLCVYPSSLLFYLVPRDVTRQAPEALLFWLGAMSASMFWAAVSLIALYAYKLVRRVAPRLAPPN